MATTAYCLYASWAQNYEATYDISASWAQEYNATDILGSWAQEYTADHDLEGSWAHKYLQSEAYDLYVRQPPQTTITLPNSGGTVSVNNFYNYGWRVSSGGANFDDYPLPSGNKNIQKHLSITQPLNNPATMRFECWDPDSVFGPFGASSTVFDIDTHKVYQESAIINRTFKPTIKVGGSVWSRSPEFLVMTNPWRLASAGEQYVGVDCVDFSQLLLEDDDCSYGSFNSESGSIWMASQILTTILESKGLSHRLEIHDYPVLRFSAVGGPPLDHVKALLYFAQADWWLEGRTFCARSSTGGNTWTFEDVYTVNDFEYVRSRRGLFNELVLNKEEVQSNVLVDQRCVGRQCLGFQTARWDQGVNTSVAYVKDIVNGSVDSWVWRDVNGTPINDTLTTLGSGGPRVLSMTPVHEVQFVYRPNFGILGSGGHFGPGGVATAWTPDMIPAYHLQIIGRRFITDPMFGEFTKKMNVRAVNSTSQGRLGRKLGRALDTTVLARREDVDYLLAQLIAKNLRQENIATIQLNVNNPEVLPGDKVIMKIERAGMASGKSFVAEQLVKDASGQMQMVLSRSNDMG